MAEDFRSPLEFTMPMPLSLDQYLEALRSDGCSRAMAEYPGLISPMQDERSNDGSRRTVTRLAPCNLLPAWVKAALDPIHLVAYSHMPLEQVAVWETVLSVSGPSPWSAWRFVQRTEILNVGEHPSWCEWPTHVGEAQRINIDVLRDFEGEGPPTRKLSSWITEGKLGPAQCVLHQLLYTLPGDSGTLPEIPAECKAYLLGTVRARAVQVLWRHVAVNMGRWMLLEQQPRAAAVPLQVPLQVDLEVDLEVSDSPGGSRGSRGSTVVPPLVNIAGAGSWLHRLGSSFGEAVLGSSATALGLWPQDAGYEEAEAEDRFTEGASGEYVTAVGFETPRFSTLELEGFNTPPSTPREMAELKQHVAVLEGLVEEQAEMILQLQMEAAVEDAEGIKGELRLGHDLSNLAVLASSMPSQLPEMAGMDGMLWLVLTVGTPMDKVKADGKVHRIVLQLSPDLATIRWHTVGAIYNSRKRTYPLEKVKRILVGCRLKRERLTAIQVARSFSLMFVDRYLDLIAPNEASYDIWVRGIAELLGIVPMEVGVVTPTNRSPKSKSEAPGGAHGHRRSHSSCGFRTGKDKDPKEKPANISVDARAAASANARPGTP